MTRAIIASFIQVALASVLLVLAFNVDAATLTAASCSRSDVQTQITAALDGDTVAVPAGRVHSIAVRRLA